MTSRNTAVKQLVVLVVALAILAIGMTGSWMMWSVVRSEYVDIDIFMKAYALIILAITCWIPIQQLLKEAVRNTKADAKAIMKCTKAKARRESLVTKTGKMLAFKKEVGQQA